MEWKSLLYIQNNIVKCTFMHGDSITLYKQNVFVKH